MVWASVKGALQRVDGEAAALGEETQQAMAQEVELPYVVGALPDRHDAGVADHLAQRLQVVQGCPRVKRIGGDGVVSDPIRKALLASEADHLVFLRRPFHARSFPRSISDHRRSDDPHPVGDSALAVSTLTHIIYLLISCALFLCPQNRACPSPWSSGRRFGT
jgi:hypothetical protein